MTISVLRSALAVPRPVLFAYIGWGNRYDGTEAIIGGHKWLRQQHPKDCTEVSAFAKNSAGMFECGVGRGNIEHKRLHVVFVARDPVTRIRCIVGIYASAQVIIDNTWARVRTKHVVLIPTTLRPALTGWTGKQGMRRWAWRGASLKDHHPALREAFEYVTKSLKRFVATQNGSGGPTDQIYTDLKAVEGAIRTLLVKSREREFKLRDAKLEPPWPRTEEDSFVKCPGVGLISMNATAVSDMDSHMFTISSR